MKRFAAWILCLAVCLGAVCFFLGRQSAGGAVRVRTERSAGAAENAGTPEAPEETEPEEVSRYAALNVTEDDIDMLAALAWHEARGEPFEGQVAVVLTALNRCLSPEFPDTVEEVVFQKYGDVWQFSPAPYLWTAEPTQTQYDAVYTALHDTDYILPAEAVFFSTKAYNDNIVAVIGNHIFCSIEEVTQ